MVGIKREEREQPTQNTRNGRTERRESKTGLSIYDQVRQKHRDIAILLVETAHTGINLIIVKNDIINTLNQAI